jgi:hypothetical protein
VKKVSLIFLLFILSGCGTLYSVGPSAIVESPEIPHDQTSHSDWFLKSEPAQYFHIANDVSRRPLDVSTQPDLQNAGALVGGVNFVMSPRIQLGFGIDTGGLYASSFVGRGMIKYLVDGDTFNKAIPGSHAFSVYANPAYGRVDVSGDQNGLFGNGGYPWRASSQFLGLGLGASYGYYKSDQSFYYVGVAYESYNIEASVHQDASKTGDYPAASAAFPLTQGNSTTVALGYRFGVKNRLTIAASYSKNNWQNFSQEQQFLSIGMGGIDFFKPMQPIQPLAQKVE